MERIETAATCSKSVEEHKDKDENQGSMNDESTSNEGKLGVENQVNKKGTKRLKRNSKLSTNMNDDLTETLDEPPSKREKKLMNSQPQNQTRRRTKPKNEKAPNLAHQEPPFRLTADHIQQVFGSSNRNESKNTFSSALNDHRRHNCSSAATAAAPDNIRIETNANDNKTVNVNEMNVHRNYIDLTTLSSGTSSPISIYASHQNEASLSIAVAEDNDVDETATDDVSIRTGKEYSNDDEFDEAGTQANFEDFDLPESGIDDDEKESDISSYLDSDEEKFDQFTTKYDDNNEEYKDSRDDEDEEENNDEKKISMLLSSRKK